LFFALEGRKRIKMDIFRIDRTFDTVRFSYTDLQTGERKEVKTAEELKYPMLTKDRLPPLTEDGESGQEVKESGRDTGTEPITAVTSEGRGVSQVADAGPKTLDKPLHFTVAENQTGISYRDLFGEYLRGAHSIKIVDPYIRKQYQIRNILELMQVVLDGKAPGEEVVVHLVTDSGDFSRTEIDESLRLVQADLMKVDITFTYEFDDTRSLHARSITTDTGWKISLDRGLDIYQRFEGGLLSLASMDQRARFCKAFEVTYLRSDGS